MALYSSTIIADAPQVYLELDESSGSTATDTSGNAHNFAATGVTWGQTSLFNPLTGTSVTTNGTSSYLAGAYAAWMDSSSITCVFRYKHGAGGNFYVGRWGTAGQRPWLLQMSSGKVIILIDNGLAATGATTLTVGQTYTIALRTDGSTAKLYINGIEDASVSSAGPTQINAAMEIGRAATSAYAVTNVDGFAFWNTAISADQIAKYHRLAISSTYNSEVLADSPWGFWKTDETSGSTLADSSGNARSMAITGSPTLAQIGPNNLSADAVSWPSSVGTEHYAATTATFGFSAATFEAWVYLAATPTANTPIIALGTAYGTGGNDKYMYVGTDGKVRFYVFNSGDLTVVSSTALSLNTWNHVVASVGSAGTQIRINKTTTATNVNAASSVTAAKVFIHGGGIDGSGGNAINATDGSAVIVSRAAVYPAQLTDARTDMHYESGFGLNYAGEVMADLPLAYYRLDEPSGTVAGDSSGNAHPLNYSGVSTLGAPGLITTDTDAGVVNATTGGTTHQISNSYSSWMDVGSSFGVELWFKGNGSYIVQGLATRDAGFTSLWVLYLNSSGNVIFTKGTGGSVTSSGTYLDNLPHHVFVTYNGSTITLYIDGVSAGTAAASGAMSSASFPFSIANGNFGSGGYNYGFIGTVDEVALYSTVLTASRVKAHYQAGVFRLGLQVPPADVFTRTVFGSDYPPYAAVSAAAVAPTITNTFTGGPFPVPSSSLSVALSDTSSTPTVGYADNFSDRVVLTDEYGVYDGIDLSSATLETGEPNPLSATKTWWFEYMILVDLPAKMRVRAFGGSGSVGVAVFRSTNPDTDPANDVNPVFSDLALVASSSSGDVTWSTTDGDGSYYIQVGLLSGAGTGWFLEYTFADPGDGGTFGTAIEIGGEYGGDQIDIWNDVAETGQPNPVTSQIRHGWFRWTCPDPAPSGQMTFTSEYSESTGNHGIAVYTGVAVNALTLVATSGTIGSGNPALVQFTPTANTVYYIQVATTLDRGTFDLSWFGPANLASPAQVFRYIRTEVYDKTGQTKITEIKNRFAIEFKEILNTTGTGQFSIHADDPILTAYPSLLNHRNIVKFWLGSKCVSAFRIQIIKTTVVSSDETAGMVKTISGPTVHYLMDDFMVKHYLNKSRPGTTFDERNYTWASPPTGWFDASLWTDKYNVNSQTQPPGGKPGTPYRKRPKYGYPKKWRDKYAKWMWLSTNPAQNENNYASPRPIRKLHYYRHNVTIAKNGTPVRLYASADAGLNIYLNGDLVINRPGQGNGYKTFVFYDAILGKGLHTIAILMHSLDNTNIGDRNEAVIFSMARMGSSGKPVQWLLRSGRGWYCYHGLNVPTWNRAKILRSIVTEARARGNESANYLGFGFSAAADTSGRNWVDHTSLAAKIGTSAQSIQAELSEGETFDVWVNPSTLNINAYRSRGTDKSHSVALIPGVNLIDWEVTNTDDVKNDFLVRYEKGFFDKKNPSSISAYGHREGYVELGGVNDRDHANTIITQAMVGVEAANLAAGSPDIMLRREFQGSGSVIGVEGSYPFLDYDVGDIIMSPGEDGTLARHRIIGLSCTENADGYLTFDPDLEVSK